MKNPIIISLLFLFVGYGQQGYYYNELIEMDNGLWTLQFSDEPITGQVYDYFEEFKPYSGAIISGKKVYMGNMVEGKKEGKWKSYFHSNGKKKFDENWKDGERDGLFTQWYENGKKQKRGTYEDGRLDGVWIWWFENGQKKDKGTYKYGKQVGLFTQWYENGQKSFEGTYKDGKEDGFQTEWYGNGEKKLEGTFKDGVLVELIGMWNEDGSVKK